MEVSGGAPARDPGRGNQPFAWVTFGLVEATDEIVIDFADNGKDFCLLSGFMTRNAKGGGSRPARRPVVINKINQNCVFKKINFDLENNCELRIPRIMNFVQ